MTTSAQPPDAATTSKRLVVQRHSLTTRLGHWVTVLAMGILLMSGLQILNAHPALYWGETGFEPARAWLAIGDDDGDPPRGTLRLGRHQWDTTGWLGIVMDGDNTEQKAFPGGLTIPTGRDLATGRRWHLFFAWVLVTSGLIYFVTSIASGHIRRDLWLTSAERSPRRLLWDLWHHLRLRFPKGEAARVYNPLQKLAYLGVIFGVAPLMVLTGLTLSPAMNAAAPFLLDVFGGRQSARSLHFICAGLLVLFLFIHLAALLAVGVWNELRSMITGRYVISTKE
jgi:thiosulfate reductase cytochrome b subunit